MIETRLLHCCLMLAKHQNFARAAKSLNVSQPTLTRSIQLLETNVGEQLFDRTSRQVLPTKAGEIVLKHARIIIASTESMLEEIGNYKGLVDGALLIGCGVYAGSDHLASALSRFSMLYPAIKINIRVDDWRIFADRMMQEDFDFVLMETSELEDSRDFEITRFNNHPAFFFCRKNHPLLDSESLKISDLSQYPFISPALPKRLAQLIGLLFYPDSDESAAFRKVRKYDCNDLGTIKSVINSSDSIGIGTYGILAAELEAGLFDVFPFRIPALQTDHHIVKKRGLSLSPAARAFLEILVETDKAQSISEIALIESLDQEITPGNADLIKPDIGTDIR